MKNRIIRNFSLFTFTFSLSAAVAAMPERPYELAWANRTADEFPPVARMEKADGWRVEAVDAEAKVETTAARAVFGDSVVRLSYRATGENPRVTLVPPEPIAVPAGSDTVTLWVRGNNVNGKSRDPENRGEEVKSVYLNAMFGEAAADLGIVRHCGWHEMTAIGKLPKGAAFTGLTVTGCTEKVWRSLDVTSLCVFKDPQRPLPPPRVRSLPFPNRPEGIVPPVSRLAEKLEFRLPEDPLDWGALAFRYGDSDWIPLAVGGGLFPRERSVGAKVGFRQVGNSLVCEIERAEPGVEEVRFGAVKAPAGSFCTRWPYYTYRSGNLRAMRRRHGMVTSLRTGVDKDGDPIFRPQTAAVRIGGKTLFVNAMYDWYVTGASEPICEELNPPETLLLNGGLYYFPKTDGTLNPCRERLVWTFSENPADVFPAIPNPKSPYMREMGSGSWTSHHAGDRAKDTAYWRAVKKAGMHHIIITDHESGWRDGHESFTFRTRTAPGKGGDEGQYDYARVLIDELGYRYGPYNNFTDFAAVNEYWSIDRVARYPDGSLIPAWYRCYAPKSTFGVAMCERLPPVIQKKFRFNTAYCDVGTCFGPWMRVDYDSRAPGAGTMRQVFDDFGEIFLMQRKTWGGPVYSEGGIHWMYAGIVDGNYAEDPEYDFLTEPWLVDFDLARLHDISVNFGMGEPWMFYIFNSNERPHDWNGKLRKENYQLWIDRFTAATLAFGHPGYFIHAVENAEKGDFTTEEESYYPVQAIAARYTQAKAAEIRYADAAGVLWPTADALVNGAAKRSQIRVVYSDGTVVAVNGNERESFRVEVRGRTYELPPFGWRGETADGTIVTFNGIEDGHRVKYARSPEYDWRK